jgi:hypothetical protein
MIGGTRALQRRSRLSSLRDGEKGLSVFTNMRNMKHKTAPAPDKLPVLDGLPVVISRPHDQARVAPSESDRDGRNLVAVVNSCFDQLSDSLKRAMRDHGIEVGRARIGWGVTTSEADAIERLSKVAEVGVTMRVKD